MLEKGQIRSINLDASTPYLYVRFISDFRITPCYLSQCCLAQKHYLALLDLLGGFYAFRPVCERCHPSDEYLLTQRGHLRPVHLVQSPVNRHHCNTQNMLRLLEKVLLDPILILK